MIARRKGGGLPVTGGDGEVEVDEFLMVNFEWRGHCRA